MPLIYHDPTFMQQRRVALDSLMVAHYVGASGGNCGPRWSWLCQSIEVISSGPQGVYTSIDIFPDIDPDPLHSTWKVGVSYGDATNKAIRYAQYTCSIVGHCNWATQVVFSDNEPDAEVGRFSSLKFNFYGVPGIAFYYNYYGYISTESNLMYARYTGDGTGDCRSAADWECSVADEFQGAGMGLYPSLDFDYGGIPYIAYYDGIDQALKYAEHAGIGTCGNGDWACHIIDDSSANVGLFPSMLAPQYSGDVPRVAYYDSTNGKLKYTYYVGNGTGNCGVGNSWQCNEIDDMGVGLSQASISLAVDSNNTPMIAYTDGHQDLAPLALKVARPAYGQPYANCAGALFYDWWCMVLDTGYTDIHEAEYVSLGIKPNGLAMIAYSEFDTYAYPAEYNLKIAYQGVMNYLPTVMK